MTPVSCPCALTVPLMLGGKHLYFTYFICVIMTLFGLLHMGEHMNIYVPFPSPLEKNTYANTLIG